MGWCRFGEIRSASSSIHDEVGPHLRSIGLQELDQPLSYISMEFRDLEAPDRAMWLQERWQDTDPALSGRHRVPRVQKFPPTECKRSASSTPSTRKRMREGRTLDAVRLAASLGIPLSERVDLGCVQLLANRLTLTGQRPRHQRPPSQFGSSSLNTLLSCLMAWRKWNANRHLCELSYSTSNALEYCRPLRRWASSS